MCGESIVIIGCCGHGTALALIVVICVYLGLPLIVGQLLGLGGVVKEGG